LGRWLFIDAKSKVPDPIKNGGRFYTNHSGNRVHGETNDVQIKSHRPIGGILIFYLCDLPPAVFAFVPLSAMVEPGLYAAFAPTFWTSHNSHLHENYSIFIILFATLSLRQTGPAIAVRADPRMKPALRGLEKNIADTPHDWAHLRGSGALGKPVEGR
jgi:hypothetical protein